MVATDQRGAERVQALEQKAHADHITPFWTVVDQAHPNEPISRLEAHVWRWPLLQELLDEACVAVDTSDGKAERRAYTLLNPGLGGRYATTHTLIAGVQKMLPGEKASVHRHAPDALRFIIEGESAYTVVEGEQIAIWPGDLVLTPNWKLHDHGNAADGEAVAWMDALDVPLVNLLDASFMEQFPARSKPITPARRVLVPPLRARASQAKLGGRSRATCRRRCSSTTGRRRRPRCGASPRWPPTRSTTWRCNTSAHFTGGPVMPGYRLAGSQMLRPGVHTRAHRHTASVVYFVVRGQGHSIVNGTRYDWAERDFLVLPNWAWHEHVNEGDEDAILFSIQHRRAASAGAAARAGAGGSRWAPGAGERSEHRGGALKV